MTSSFLTRLIEEETQLEERYNKLMEFLKGGKFDNIDPVQVDLLVIQSAAMNTYLLCLKQRLRGLRAQFGTSSNPPGGPGTPP